MRNLLIVFLGAILIILLIIFNYKMKNYFYEKNKIDNYLRQLKSCELKLDYNVLNISLFLHTNLDEIKNTEEKTEKLLKLLEHDKDIKNNRKLYYELEEYKKSVLKKIDNIYKFETNAMPIKNAIIYITKLLSNENSIKDKNFIDYVNKIISDIIFFKNTNNYKKFIEIKQEIKKLKEFHLREKNSEEFIKILIQNANVINKHFEKYQFYLNEILKGDSLKKLNRLHKDFLRETKKNLMIITIVSFLLIVFIFFADLLILYLFYKVDRERKLLKKLLISDELTGLYNRRKYQEDMSKIETPLILIANIDRFKYYNELYGIQVGDFILKEVATILKKLLSKQEEVYLYRFGADDFIILSSQDKIDAEKIASLIIDYFKNSVIKFRNLEFRISVSIGISKYEPLIETADIALKQVKKDITKQYEFYNPKMGYLEKIEENMKRLAILKDAIEQDRITPYYQAIWNNKSQKVVKYEVLARIENNSKVESIYPYLKIAKENKLYKYITKAVYEKAFEKFKDKDVEFSLNIGISDLNEIGTIQLIDKLFNKYPSVLKNLTFEILEDDSIQDYNTLKEFIVFAKSKGCKIALDDFGSGYSNFAHVLNLDIDFLKIDGSLIENLSSNRKMEMIVKTIIEFSQQIGIKTIAEYVINKKIYEKVKELGIDYSQGFYLSEPSDKLVGEE